VLEWYGATSEVAWLFLLAAWMPALGVATAAYAAWNRAGLRLALGVRSSIPAPNSPLEELPEQLIRAAPGHAPLFEGDGAELEVGLDTSGAARGPAWVAGAIGGSEVTLATGIVPRAGWRQSFALDRLRRGALDATDWSIGTSDPLGFFTGRRDCADGEVGLVLPRFASLAARRPVRELEASVVAPRTGSGNELFGIREYRPGDSLRRIHWRSSARHGHLVVREYEPPGLQTTTMVLDPSPPTVDVADQIARIAASEAWDCIREGGRVTLGQLSTRDLWEVLEWLARYPATPVTDVDLEPDIVVTADPDMLEARAVRNWLVGEAPVRADVTFQRVGMEWPL
jgi:uncharacterized protein (DUF58 family)